MPSPFPGMDPYIEDHSLWGDFHNSLANAIRTQLNAKIRPNYYARQIPCVADETLGIGRTNYASTTAIAEPPLMVESKVEIEEPLTLHSVEIYTAVDDELVAVVEILSPINKRSGRNAQEQYLRKRQDILNTTTVHFFEIDLLRGGNRPPLLRPVPEAPYYMLLSRADLRPRVTVWPIQLTDSLPVVMMPLKHPDADVELDMRQAVAEVYEQGAYDLQINYADPPPLPSLSPQQQEFVDKVLQPLRS